MIKANELRIGNYILYKEYGEGDGVIGKIKPGDFGLICGGNDEYHPIHLTPEWLEKCGAKPNVRNNRWDIEYNESVYVLRLFEQGFSVGIEIEKNERFADKSFVFGIKFVHQLQNLYFALTEEELKVKLP